MKHFLLYQHFYRRGTGLIAALQGGYILAQASRYVDHMTTAIEMALARSQFFADHDRTHTLLCSAPRHASARNDRLQTLHHPPADLMTAAPLATDGASTRAAPKCAK